MHFEGEFRVRSDPQNVYALLVDPARVVRLLPDVEVLELRAVDADTVRARLKTGVSFLKGTFVTEARVMVRDPPRRAGLNVRAQGMGSSFDVVASADVSPSDGETAVAWTANVTIRGTVASLGARLLPGIVEAKTTEFVDALRKELQR